MLHPQVARGVPVARREHHAVVAVEVVDGAASGRQADGAGEEGEEHGQELLQASLETAASAKEREKNVHGSLPKTNLKDTKALFRL